VSSTPISSKTIADLAVGDKIYFGTIYGNKIVWRVLEHGHSGYPSGSTTLIADKIITVKCFDAKEPNNTNGDRSVDGNTRYSVSNIQEWLNSNATTGAWYSAQHTYDEPPNSSYVNSGYNPYDTAAGFLNGFTATEQGLLLSTSLNTALCSIDGGGSETVTDKMFLLSETEVGLGNENSIAEGIAFSYFSSNTIRKFYPTADAVNNDTSKHLRQTNSYAFSLRTPNTSRNGYIRVVSADGALDYWAAYDGYDTAILPACNLPSTAAISSLPDSNGVYSLT
jgi:hypothetical protein